MQPEPAAAEQSSRAGLARLISAYQASQAVYVAAELGVADALVDGPKTSGELAESIGADPASLRRLLRALAAFGVFTELEADRFAITPMGSYLRTDLADSLRPLARLFGSEHWWHSWTGLLHAVRTGESAFSHLYGMQNPFDHYADNPELGARTAAGMTALSAAFAAAVVAAYDFPAEGTLLDAGGGHGQLLASILRARPRLRGVLFDLPNVIAGAGPLLAEAGVTGRSTAVAGDLFAEVPSGADLYLLSRVIHDWDDERAAAILRNVRRAMHGSARLLMVERVLPDHIEPGPLAQALVLSDLNMLVRTGGRERTADEYRQLAETAGLRVTRVISTDSAVSVVEVVGA